jgi:hypothetical protein
MRLYKQHRVLSFAPLKAIYVAFYCYARGGLPAALPRLSQCQDWKAPPIRFNRELKIKCGTLKTH